MAKLYSGVDYIDGILSGISQDPTFANSWSRSTTVGEGVTITYDWMTEAPDDAPVDPSSYESFTASQRIGATAAMAMFSEIADIQFNRDTSGTAEIEYGTLDFGGSLSGFTAGFAQRSWAIIGNPATNSYYTKSSVYMTNAFEFMEDQTPGGLGFGTMMHEIGHALGLSHTFDNIQAPAGQDSEQYSVMSYTGHPVMTVEPSGLLLHDIAAIQYLYGANMTTRTGNDTYSWDADDSPLLALWDAGGVDTIDASSQNRRAVIDLNDGAFSSIGSNGSGSDAVDNVAIAYGAVFENAVGTGLSDTLTGNDVDNTLNGGAGSDTFKGGDGADLIIGGLDNDEIFGEDGNDRLRGNSGRDTVDGGAGDDRIDGASGGDNLMGAAGIDVVEGEGGNDIIDGGDGDDRVRGGGGFDTVLGSDGDDRVEGNAGGDVVDGGAGADEVTGGSGDDTVTGGSGNDFLNGNSGDDTLEGGTGADTLEGGSGNDILDSGASVDTLEGGAGNDTLTGGAGRDTFIFGRNGDQDRVTDFEDDLDNLAIDDNLYGATLTAAQIVSTYGTDITGGVRLDFGSGDRIDVLGTGVDTASIVNDILIV